MDSSSADLYITNALPINKEGLATKKSSFQLNKGLKTLYAKTLTICETVLTTLRKTLTLSLQQSLEGSGTSAY